MAWRFVCLALWSISSRGDCLRPPAGAGDLSAGGGPEAPPPAVPPRWASLAALTPFWRPHAPPRWQWAPTAVDPAALGQRLNVTNGSSWQRRARTGSAPGSGRRRRKRFQRVALAEAVRLVAPWLCLPPTEWMCTAEAVCSAPGVRCNGTEPLEIVLDGRGANVTLLRTVREFPRILCNVSSLKRVRLKHLNIHGTLPPEIGVLPALVVLDLSHNQLSGTIPPEVCSMEKLMSLDLSDNNLTGSIPENLTNMEFISRFDLSANRLTGTIPESLGTLEYLEKLDLHDNYLFGPIPFDLPRMKNLRWLDLSYNLLTGTMPRAFANVTRLVLINVSSNHLSGPLTVELRDFKHFNEVKRKVGRIVMVAEEFNLGDDPSQRLVAGSCGVIHEIGVHGNFSVRMFNDGTMYPVSADDMRHFRVAPALMAFDGQRNNFSGPISPMWSRFCLLESLELSSNQLEGQLPGELSLLQNLGFLNIARNHITGTIPAEFGDFRRLQVLCLSINQIGGSIPPELGRIANLTWFAAGTNQLSGTLPATLGQLTKVGHMDLMQNAISGTIPPELGRIQHLECLFLSYNELTGTIPRELASLSNLEVLDLTTNRLTGSIPPELGQLAKVYQLDLSRNSLSGSIPSELAMIRNITYFDISHNELSGTLPAALARLTEAKLLDISNNELTGTLPAELGSMVGLYYLNIEDNEMVGTIPVAFGNLREIRFLNIANNWFEGTIPRELGNLKHLEGLFVQRNVLSGCIPPELNHTSLTFFAAHENFLDGHVPELDLSGCSGSTCLFPNRTPVLTLYGNRLSCAVTPPKLPPGRKIRGSISLGNKFSYPVPDWLLEDSDEVNFEKELWWTWVWQTGTGGVIWLAVAALILRRQLVTMFKELWTGIGALSPEWAAHRFLILGIVCALPVTCGYLLPVYYSGSSFMECGDRLAHLSITYMSRRVPYVEMAALVGWLVYVLLTAHWISLIAKTIPRTEREPNFYVKRVVQWTGWACTAMPLASVLPWAYAVGRALPAENRIKQSLKEDAYHYIFYLTPTANALFQIMALPMMAELFERKFGIPARRLLSATHVVCCWMVPTFTALMMSEECGKRWRELWVVCDTHKFDVVLPNVAGDVGKELYLMRTSDICQVPPLSHLKGTLRGDCVREVLAVVSPLLTVRLIFEAAVFPTLMLLVWSFCVKGEGGHLRLPWLGWRMSFTTDEYFVQLDIWAATAVLWGPLVPLIHLLVLLAVAVSLANLWFETQHFRCYAREAEEEQPKEGVFISETFMWQVLTILLFYIVFFCMETGVAMPSQWRRSEGQVM